MLGLLLLGGITAWRLSEGPVRLDFLAPHIEDAVNSSGGALRFQIGGARLAWGGWERTLDILVNDVRAVGKDDRLVAGIPEMSVTFSLRALIRGVVAPTSFDIIGPKIRLVRNESGRVAIAMEEQDSIDPDLFAGIVASLDGRNDPLKPLTYLTRFSILDARVRVEDRFSGISWTAPSLDLVLLREKGEIRGTVFGAVDVGSTPVRFDAKAAWKPGDSSIDVSVGLYPVRLDRFALLAPRFEVLSGIQLPVEGHASLLVGVDGRIYDGSFSLQAGAGQLVAGELWRKPVQVSGATMKGRFNTDPGLVEIERLAVSLGETTATLSATALKLDETGSINGEVTLDRLALNDLRRYWPADAGVSARTWILGHMSNGQVQDAAAKFVVDIPKIGEPEFRLGPISGRMRMKGVSIDYLPGLPPLEKVDATAVFRNDRYIASVTAGTAGGLDLDRGTVRLTGLDSDREMADIDVSIAGSLGAALGLIDNKPLGYAKAFGIDPLKVEGRARTQLKLRMPMINDLRLDQIDIAAAAEIKDAGLPSFAFGQPIEGGDFKLNVSAERLTLQGTAKLAGIPTRLRWQENFRSDAPVARHYEASGKIPVAELEKFGVSGLSPYVDGTLATDIAYMKTSAGAVDIVVKADLGEASLFVPGFDWRKQPGEKGVAWFAVSVAEDGAAEVRKFDVQARDLRARGHAKLSAKGSLQTLKLDQFDLGRTRTVATIAVDRNGLYDIALKGPVFDATKFIERAGEGEDTELPPLRLNMEFDRVWFDPDTPVETLKADLSYDGKSWRRGAVTGTLGKDRSLSISMETEGDRRKARLTSNNAGAALRALDFVDTMQGGELLLEAGRPLSDSNAAWDGTLTISNFSLVKAPIMARILTLASLTGITNALAGKGIQFATLNVPFTWRDGVITVTTARAVGSELGLTSDGTISVRNKKFGLNGTIIPAYTFNSALGNIPVVGRIFSGGKGGGIFAATYKVSGEFEKPDVSVNALAALAPGFLRNFLSVFDGVGGKIVPSKSSKIPDQD